MLKNITDLHIVDVINRKLFEEYRVLDGRPIYRLVWSDDQLELRVGTFTDWYGSILIREEHKALREIKKYWYLEQQCWVLEKLVFMPKWEAMKDLLEELVQARNGTYEPVYTFIGADNSPLPVSFPVVEYIIQCLHNPQKLTEKDYKAIYDAEERAETQYFEEKLGEEERSPLFVWEESAFVSTNQLKFKQTYVEKSGQVTLD